MANTAARWIQRRRRLPLIPATEFLQPTEDFTLEAWVRPEGSG